MGSVSRHRRSVQVGEREPHQPRSRPVTEVDHNEPPGAAVPAPGGEVIRSRAGPPGALGEVPPAFVEGGIGQCVQ